MIRCKALKYFGYSLSGLDRHAANAGDDILLPDAIVSGLEGDGYISIYGAQKAIHAAPENKMMADVNNKTNIQKRGRGRPKKGA